MPPHQLAVDRFNHVGNIEAPALPRQFGVEHHLQKQVAQLVLKLLVVAGFQRLEDLVSLFN